MANLIMLRISPKPEKQEKPEMKPGFCLDLAAWIVMISVNPVGINI